MEKIISDTEIRITGIDALNQALGDSGAYRFLTLLNSTFIKQQLGFNLVEQHLYKTTIGVQPC